METAEVKVRILQCALVVAEVVVLREIFQTQSLTVFGETQ